MQIERATRLEGTRQIAVTHDGRADAPECRIAEDVVGVHVGVDQEANRLCGYLSDSGDKGVRLDQAAAAVDDGNGIGADDDAQIADRTVIGGGHQFICALEGEDAVGDLPEREPQVTGRGSSEAAWQQRGAGGGAGEATHKPAS